MGFACGDDTFSMLRRMTLTLCRFSMLAQFSLRRLQRYLSIAQKINLFVHSLDL